MTTSSTKNKKPFTPIKFDKIEGHAPEEVKRIEEIANRVLKESYDNPHPEDDEEFTDFEEYVPITGDSVQAVFVNKTPKTPKKKK